MDKIEERAEKASKILMREEHRRWYRVGYIHAVTAQREIDIERACNEFSFFLARLVEKDIEALRPEVLREDVKVWISEFRNAMMEE